MKHLTLLLLLIALCSCEVQVKKPAHPPLFAQELARNKTSVDAAMATEFLVPTPKDMAGGYTHEVHKQHWKTLGSAAALYRHTGDEKYAVFVRDALLKYAEVYTSWPVHPTNRSYATGKIFWQCLNDANWLVYVSQAYGDIYDWLDDATKAKLNTELFRPMADFLSIENPQFFNRIHNHSTWGNAAVGMIGLVMNDEELIERALYGIPTDQLPDDLRDDDTGLIKSETGRAGFLAQLDLSFSPDGYFTEGPYYLRYALSPFLLFGRALADKRPDLNILAYRDGILGKAIYALLAQADPQGNFFPINDSQKGMSVYAPEVVKTVDYGYFYYGKDPELLSLAIQQNSVTLDDAGLAVATAIAAGQAEAFSPQSIAFTDGPAGDEGGVGVVRATGKDGLPACLVMKYSAQGMGHGHFDKLAYSFYNETGEVIQDYGAARWVNIDQKGGGRYLKENNSWAKQSIAHNTLVIDETSHYQGDIRIGEKHHPNLYAFRSENPTFQLISAVADSIYPGRQVQRSQWLLTDEEFERPVLIDLVKSMGTTPATHDLPTWFHGQLLEINCDYVTNNELAPMGTDHGYQHLWLEAKGQADTNLIQFNFFQAGLFYTQTSLAQPTDELLLVRLGANDPSFNLRRDQALVHRRKNTMNNTFLSVLETHGSYDPKTEVANSPFTSITNLQLLVEDKAYTAFTFAHQSGKSWLVLFSHTNNQANAEHSLTIKGRTYQWKGVHHLIKDPSNASK